MKKLLAYIINEIKLLCALITIDWEARRNIESFHREFGNSIHPSVYHPECYPDYYNSYEEWKKACE